ncbi:antitoxin Xre/MbcA/ParS toxin-binding domain-containing protein [Nocardioides yefusunii]|uniref:Antitoxin Xre/MbcA/ParS toxin-binding domain-containing protein n=1 Tax=Nocardioides yefusunii TaxID=2500546 RepID=A0ABW1QYW0_9ACTN|nr:antitoxin Xre/MbcA/ParS toxin-binding domain-containing protein [Nocardioides yefusunii]
MKRTGKSSRQTSSSGKGGRAPAVMMNPMAEQVGPEFHDETGMRDALAGPDEELLTAAELDRLCESRAVMAVAAFDGTRMFPTWQVRDGAVLPGLGEVLVAMTGQPAWSVALWVSTPHDDLDGRSPRQLLEAGDDTAGLVELAAETARRWS